jgi:hypothetical protein
VAMSSSPRFIDAVPRLPRDDFAAFENIIVPAAVADVVASGTAAERVVTAAAVQLIVTFADGRQAHAANEPASGSARASRAC